MSKVTDAPASKIEVNVSAFLLSMGAAGGGTQRADPEITWTIGGSPIGYHNAVVECAADDSRGQQLVHEWFDELRARQLPGSWHLTPSMRPSGLASLLLEAGFEHGGEEPAMAMALAHLGEPPPSDPIEIHAVGDADQLDSYRSVLAAGFGEGPKEADWVASVYSAIGQQKDSGWHHFIGTVADEPAATASLLLGDATAGIYFVCTHPEHRRRGFGAAITHHVLVDAVARGATLAVLGSSPMGQGIYERLGFRTVFSYQLYEWEP